MALRGRGARIPFFVEAKERVRLPRPPPRVRVFKQISFLRLDWRPLGQDFNVSFLSLLELSVEDEGWLDCEVQRGVILKIDGDGVISASGKQFDFLDGLAANQREFHETSVGKVSLVESKLAGRGGSFLIPQAEKPSKMARRICSNSSMKPTAPAMNCPSQPVL